MDTFGDERTGMTPDQVKALQVRRYIVAVHCGLQAAQRSLLQAVSICSIFNARLAGGCLGLPLPPLLPLQEVLRPILLRRMKEDVETLPEKEEVGGHAGLLQRAACCQPARSGLPLLLSESA